MSSHASRNCTWSLSEYVGLFTIKDLPRIRYRHTKEPSYKVYFIWGKPTSFLSCLCYMYFMSSWLHLFLLSTICIYSVWRYGGGGGVGVGSVHGCSALPCSDNVWIIKFNHTTWWYSNCRCVNGEHCFLLMRPRNNDYFPCLRVLTFFNIITCTIAWGILFNEYTI